MARKQRFSDHRSDRLLGKYDKTPIGKFLRWVHDLFCSRSRFDALAGQLRIQYDHRVILGVQEEISFAHRTGVGTVWRGESGQYFEGSPKAFFGRLLEAINLVFPSILPVRLKRWMVWECSVPCARIPPPLREQRRLMKLYESWGYSPAFTRLSLGVPTLPSTVPQAPKHDRLNPPPLRE